MLSHEDNGILCRVGPGTLMGDLMRQYWLPGLMSVELPEADGAPVRLRLLGENLIAFRTTSGAVGVLADACPHRGASMFFGRNEEEGLRCVYHGWKFDVSGACADMPNEPAESNFKHKIRATSYRAVERNGVLWVYMGPRETPPPLPGLEPNLLPDGEWQVTSVQRECNYMQALEGDIDTSHLGFLHLGAIPPEAATPGTFSEYSVRYKDPKYEVVDTGYGTMYGAYRPAEADSYYWRVAHFLFPCYTMPPVGVLGLKVVVRAWVPLDDDHTMFIMMGPKMGRANASMAGPRQVDTSVTRSLGAGGMGRFLENTTANLGRWRMAANRSNDYQLDRQSQQTDSYSGIAGIHLQDQAITESMGPIYRRNQEHLGTSDMMIIRTRKRMIQAAKALRETGAAPPGVEAPDSYGVRAGGVILKRDQHWLDATSSLRAAFVDHPELDLAVTGNIPGA